MVPSKGSILCAVEDEPADAVVGGGGDGTCARLSSVFREFGYEVVPGGSAAEVLALARDRQFVLYILDTAFDENSGLALCSRLKILAPPTPVILYSRSRGGGGDDEEAPQSGIDAGALAYVLKPNFDHLLLAVLHALPRE